MSTDRRIRYTKMFLRESLLKLLENKPLSRITVKEICEDAAINRSTYYTYYTDPRDQFNELEQNLFDELTARAEYTPVSGSTDSGKEHRNALRRILSYMEEHKNVFRILINRSESYYLWRDFLRFFDQKIFTEVRIEMDLPMEKQLQYVYATAGCFGLIEHWLMNDSDLTADDIAKKIETLNNSIFL